MKEEEDKAMKQRNNQKGRRKAVVTERIRRTDSKVSDNHVKYSNGAKEE
jgi:hypothetical protein